MKVTLTVIEGPHSGTTFEFEQHDTFIVGRAPNAQLRPKDDLFFSRNHFLIEVSPPLCRLIDLNSRNKTFVNGKKVDKADLKNGDRIRGGKTTIAVMIEEQVAPTQEEAGLGVGLQTLVPRGHARPATKQKTSEQPTVVPNASGNTPKDSRFDDPPGRPRFDPVRAIQRGDTDKLPLFPGYRTIRVLGRGGMGIVYEADSLLDHSRVAVKVILPNISAAPDDLSRFIREASILRDLVHPNIVRYRDLSQKDGQLFIVMDFIEGTTAEALMAESEEPMSVSRAVSLTRQLLDALTYAHQRGYVHRDVKPANLMITTRDGIERLSLADFGLAKTYQSSKLSGLTMTGEIGGTTPFMPPEQITNYRSVDPAADQYSAAATLYYLLTKQHIYEFPREVPAQLLMVLQEDPVSIDQRRPGLPKKLSWIIHKALSREPGGRFADVAEMQKELRSVGV